ncbi:DndE family protein [Stenotrophomonas maltophilia]|uniref:DndE family protein n=1 Tax=Stenotrophomonas maltophilia TaxID=40324 RepID=UPI001FA7971C|nr:DndE family protein [Stenotrophomonas maltophilia]
MSTEANDYLTLEVIAGTAFRSTADTDELSQRVKDRLGFGSYNIPARLAMARSLALPGQPAKAEGEVGRIIKGDVLFGTGADLASWVSLFIEHAGSPLTIKDLQSAVQRHWARGMKILSEELDASGGDTSEFWRRLAESALPEVTEKRRNQVTSVVAEASRGPVPVRLGEIGRDVATNEEVIWTLNAPGGSPHSAFMGGVGSGKTRTAAFVLRSIAEQTNVPLLAFDFKGDMADRHNALDRAFDAQVLSPPLVPIPLDVFALSDRSKHGIISTAQRLRDSLSNLKQTKFGDLQKRRLNDALEEALRTRSPCTLEDVRDCLENAYASAGAKEDGAIAALVDLCRLPLFEPKMSPEEFFSKSWIISLPANVPELVRVTVVALLTDALERFINSQQDSETDSEGNRSLRILCVVDEAHRALEARLPGLSNLIRLGRSKGAAVMLISQKPDDFEGEDDDFLSEMGLLVCFGTNAREASVKRILGAGASLTSLKTGEAFVRARGDAKARKVLAWK